MPKRIGELIPEVLRQASKAHDALEQLQDGWARLVGRQLASHSSPTSLRRGKLYVAVDRPEASFLISFVKTRVLASLSQQTGHEIQEMVVRMGEVSHELPDRAAAGVSGSRGHRGDRGEASRRAQPGVAARRKSLPHPHAPKDVPKEPKG